jgi:hypothetical protein
MLHISSLNPPFGFSQFTQAATAKFLPCKEHKEVVGGGGGHGTANPGKK